jgi:hypothetical protein
VVLVIEGENGKISKKLFDITRWTLDCYTSDIRADILMMAIEQEEKNNINEQLDRMIWIEEYPPQKFDMWKRYIQE